MSIGVWSWIQRKTNAYEVSLNGKWLRHVLNIVLWPGRLTGMGFVTWYVANEDGSFKYDYENDQLVTRTRFGFIRIESRKSPSMIFMPGTS